MMSETAFFVKDVISPTAPSRSSWMRARVLQVSMPTPRHRDCGFTTQKPMLRVAFSSDEWLDMHDEPDHQMLCDREQDFVYRAVTEDIDLARHMDDAVTSLKICLAADESVRSGQPVKL
jgi:hypothetical protein